MDAVVATATKPYNLAVRMNDRMGRPDTVHPDLDFPCNLPLWSALACATDEGITSVHRTAFRLIEFRQLRLRRSWRYEYYLLDLLGKHGSPVDVHQIAWWLKHQPIKPFAAGELSLAGPQELLALSEWYVLTCNDHVELVKSWLPVRALGGDYRVFDPHAPKTPATKLTHGHFMLTLHRPIIKPGFHQSAIELQLAPWMQEYIPVGEGTILVRRTRKLKK